MLAVAVVVQTDLAVVAVALAVLEAAETDLFKVLPVQTGRPTEEVEAVAETLVHLAELAVQVLSLLSGGSNNGSLCRINC